jgi:hypothetical protein
MEEQYITFETAKLAKEKGCKNSLGLTPLAFDCTQTSLQKWLREVHNIHINIKHRPHSQSFCFTITGKYQDVNDGELVNNIFNKYKIYELALEAALQEALKLI